ncbi:hypothetical protein [Pengzhenrongella sp.]|uniref:hypothetical protein n=1 Tax=Pengzhenrongella sp. TaxID=2888820 RepID=UPI002F92DAD4
MSPQPSEPGTKLLAIDGLRKPARSVVPGPPERRPLAKPAIAPVTDLGPDQLGGPDSVSQMQLRGTPESLSPDSVHLSAVPPAPNAAGESTPARVASMPLVAPVPEQEMPTAPQVVAALDAAAQARLIEETGKLSWTEMVANPVKPTVAASKIRKAGSRGQLNVEISLVLQEHFRQHCDENRLQRVDVIEALLRTWMTSRDDPPPLK